MVLEIYININQQFSNSYQNDMMIALVKYNERKKLFSNDIIVFAPKLPRKTNKKVES